MRYRRPVLCQPLHVRLGQPHAVCHGQRMLQHTGAFQQSHRGDTVPPYALQMLLLCFGYVDLHAQAVLSGHGGGIAQNIRSGGVLGVRCHIDTHLSVPCPVILGNQPL